MPLQTEFCMSELLFVLFKGSGKVKEIHSIMTVF